MGRFAVVGLLYTHPLSNELIFIYNTMLNFIPVSFCTAYFYVTVRVRARVRVRVSFRVRVWDR